jgi:hypothetical protein
MACSLNIVIVEKSGLLKSLLVKDFKKEELFKKCGFKKSDNFVQQTEWNVKYENNKYTIQLFAKSDGRANSENKYEFPPPIDSKLFFGNCAIVATTRNENGIKTYTNLSVPMWEKIYERLFGGFEDLNATALEDEEEEDELKHISKEKKTKQGYLKDGFVVDDSSSVYDDDDDETCESNSDVSEDTGEYTSCIKQTKTNKTNNNVVKEKDESVCDEDGAELSEESYDYTD